MAKKKRYTVRYEVKILPSQREFMDPDLIRWMADNYKLIRFIESGLTEMFGPNVNAELNIEKNKNQILLWKRSEE